MHTAYLVITSLFAIMVAFSGLGKRSITFNDGLTFETKGEIIIWSG